MVAAGGVPPYAWVLLTGGLPPGLGLDAVLGRQVIGQKTVGLFVPPKQRHTSGIAHGHGQTGLDETLPVVRVDQDMPDLAFALHIRDPPVQTHALAPLSLILAERYA